MKQALGQLSSDFLSSIVFMAAYFATGNVVLATSLGIAAAIAQFVYTRWKGKRLEPMTLASLGLVIVLGTATLLTNDPRFVMIKPSIAHFTIGAIMLRSGWMLRYMPPIVVQTAPDLVKAAGYCWAALMILLGIGTVAIAMTGNMKLWASYIVLSGVAKGVAFLIQYAVMRMVVKRRIRAAGGLQAVS